MSSGPMRVDQSVAWSSTDSETELRCKILAGLYLAQGLPTYMALPVPKFPVSSWNWGGFAIYVGLGTELVLVFCEFKGLVSNWFW